MPHVLVNEIKIIKHRDVEQAIKFLKINKNKKITNLHLPAGMTGALHVWQKHCITESLTNPIIMLMMDQTQLSIIGRKSVKSVKNWLTKKQ